MPNLARLIVALSLGSMLPVKRPKLSGNRSLSATLHLLWLLLPVVTIVMSAACRRRAFVWNLETFWASHERDFWALLHVLPPPPVPSVEDFCEHFASVFGAFWSGELDPGLQHQLLSMAISPFTVAEVVTALDMMAHHCTSGIAAFPVDFYHAA